MLFPLFDANTNVSCEGLTSTDNLDLLVCGIIATLLSLIALAFNVFALVKFQSLNSMQKTHRLLCISRSLTDFVVTSVLLIGFGVWPIAVVVYGDRGGCGGGER
jgi:hypothetical protein